MLKTKEIKMAVRWTKEEKKNLSLRVDEVETDEALMEFFPERTLSSIRTVRERMGLGLKGHRKEWSAEEESLLVKEYPLCREVKDILHLFHGRTENAIKRKADTMRVSGMNEMRTGYKWTEKETLVVVSNYEKMTNEELSVILGKSEQAVACRMNQLGLKRSHEFRSMAQSGENNNFFGKTHSEDFKKAQKETMEKHWEDFQHPWIDKCHSSKTIRILSDKKTEWFKTNDHPMLGKQHSEESKKHMRVPHEMSQEGLEAIRKTMMSKPGGGYGNWQEYERKDGRRIWLQSSYEMRIAAAFDKHGYQWERNTTEAVLWHDTDGRAHSYYPDFKISTAVGSLFLETKGEHLMNDPLTIMKHEAAKQMLGDRFGVVCETEIADFEKHGILSILFGVRENF
jgi:hypothetical protein